MSILTIPVATDDKKQSQHLNNVSKKNCTVIFLIQLMQKHALAFQKEHTV